MEPALRCGQLLRVALRQRCLRQASRLPPILLQVHALTMDCNTLGLQSLPLLLRTASPGCNASVCADHPVPGQAAAGSELTERPAHQSCPSRQSGKGSDLAIGAHGAPRNGGHDQSDPVGRVDFCHLRGGRLACYTVGLGHRESTLRYLFLLFVMMPVLELYVLIRVGQWLGAWPTVGLVFLTAALGISLLRQQGLSTLRTVRARLEIGELPAREMVEGLVLVVGGAMFLAPGFITDLFGFACLLPPTRRRIAAFLMARGVWHVQASVQYGTGQGARSEAFRAESSGRIIEGEFQRDDDPRP